MNTQYKNNLKAVMNACKNYTDKKIDDLKWELGSHTLDVENDTDVAFSKTVPSGAIKCHINKIGGMSYKINQLVQNGNFVDTSNWNQYRATSSVANNEMEITVSSEYASGSVYQDVVGIANHKYLITCQMKKSNSANANSRLSIQGQIITYVECNSTNYQLLSVIGTATSNGNIRINFNGQEANQVFYGKNVMLFDLTDMGIDTSDVATATSELLKRGIDINVYNAYDSGSIRDSSVTSVVSKDSNNTTLDTYTIPAEVQALDGYGWGVNDTCYNYIYYETKKFIKKVGRVDLGTLNWTYNSQYDFFIAADQVEDYKYTTDIKGLCGKYNFVEPADAASAMANVADKSITFYRNTGTLNKRIYVKDTAYTDPTTFKTAMSGVYLYYELATPIETDISAYLTTNSIEVEGGGTLTFTNTYEQAVPSEIDYLIEEVKA